MRRSGVRIPSHPPNYSAARKPDAPSGFRRCETGRVGLYSSESVAVWVGYIALFGIAVETGVVMVVYLHEAQCDLSDQPGMEGAFSPGNVMLGGIIAAAQAVLLVGTIWRVQSLL